MDGFLTPSYNNMVMPEPLLRATMVGGQHDLINVQIGGSSARLTRQTCFLSVKSRVMTHPTVVLNAMKKAQFFFIVCGKSLTYFRVLQKNKSPKSKV
jgi:hypothetical protein